MATTTHANRLAPVAERRAFIRSVLGIFELTVALLFLLALASQFSGEQWIGWFGERVATVLTFLVGRYVAFIVPLLMGADAWSAMFIKRGFRTRLRSWTRLTGGAILVVSACALLALHLSAATDTDPAKIFEAGGLIGSFLIDAEGLNVVHYLGQTGAFITLYGLTLAGLVLFTETVLHDIGQLGLKAMGVFSPRVWGAKLSAAFASLADRIRRFFARIGDSIMTGLSRIRLANLARAIVEFPQKIVFRTDTERSRIMALRPIAELQAPGELRGDYADDDDYAAHDAEDEEPAPRRRKKAPAARSSRVLGGAAATAAATSGLADFERPKPPRRTAQQELDLFPPNYELPPIDLLHPSPDEEYKMSDEESDRLSRKIEATLEQFRIQVEVVEVVQGPVVTRFALHIAPGIKVSKILALENDLALALKAQHVRILAPIPGEAAVGIEVPNKKRNQVYLKDLMESDELAKAKGILAFPLGRNIAGEPVVADLAQMPHVLIAGATGAGKSVCLNSIIAAMLFRNPPSRLKFIMVDPKRVELSIYQAIPHLLAPVVCEPKKAAAALAWAVDQMEQRYKLLAELNVRNIEGYNAIVCDDKPNAKAMGRRLEYMPRIVVVIDELADLMMVAKNEVEEYIIRLAQMARAVGIHLILATQRPSVNVITGIIKANFPTRIAFRVSSKVDSRTILDLNGAEALLGRGDMLYSPGGVKPFRLQGSFVSDAEIEALADWIRAQEKANYEREDFEALPTPAERAKAKLMNAAMPPGSSGADDDEAYEDYDAGEDEGETDFDAGDAPMRMASRGRVNAAPLTPADVESLSDEDLYDIALRLVLESRKASVSYIQRRLKIGYARAGRIMDMMEEQGIVGPYQGSKPRDLLITPDQYLELMEAGD